MSLDRPFVLCGWDPQGQPVRPKQFRNQETADHVAHLLRASGFRVTIVPTTHRSPRLTVTDPALVVGAPWRPGS